jgi:hypothetical protein
MLRLIVSCLFILACSVAKRTARYETAEEIMGAVVEAQCTWGIGCGVVMVSLEECVSASKSSVMLLELLQMMILTCASMSSLHAVVLQGTCRASERASTSKLRTLAFGGQSGNGRSRFMAPRVAKNSHSVHCVDRATELSRVRECW